MDGGLEGTGAVVDTKLGSTPKLRALLTVIGFAFPVGLYFWFISANGVDALHADQWYDVKLIHEWSNGTLSFGDLWSPHGENRVFFQNLFTLILGRWFNYNVLIEEYVSATLLVAALVLIVLAHHRRSRSTPWFWYCPVAFLLLTVGQWGGALYGYALGWYLIVVCLAILLFLLDTTALSWLTWGVAVGAAVIASFSSLQGLFVWIAGLTILLQRRRSRPMILGWLGAAVVATGLYFSGWNSTQGSGVSYALAHPGQTLQYFFFAIGDVVSVPLPDAPHGAQWAVFAFGVCVFVVAVWSLFRYGFRPDESSSRPLGVALIWVGLLFAAGAAAARAEDGISNASFTLYVSFDLLILLGCFLAVIDQSTTDRGEMARKPWFQFGVQATVLALVLLQVLIGTANGLRYGNDYRDEQLTEAVVTARIHQAPDELVETQLGAGYETAAFIRQMISDAKSDRLSLFSTNQLHAYENDPLPTNTTAPIVSVEKPQPGDVISGGTFLVAAASDPFGITSVQFFARDEDGRRFLIASAEQTRVGWLAGWKTNNQPDGTYSIQAVASTYGGLRTSSPWVSVQLRG